MLALPYCNVRGGRLFPNGPAYPVLVLADGNWYPGEPAARKITREIPLTDWTLRLISHEPGDKALSGDDLTDTKHVEYDLGNIGSSKPWTALIMPDGTPGEDISGVGIYETTVQWDGNGHALLDLGEVCDLYRLTVNGAYVPGANPVNPVQDITKYLQPGENRITVEVASNFFHAERSRNYLILFPDKIETFYQEGIA